MFRILVEIEGTSEYAVDETKSLAKSLSEHIKKEFHKKLNDIDSGSDWFVGFVSLPLSRIEEVKYAYEEWADREGLATFYRIEDMDTPGKGTLCCDNSCVCEGCKFAFHGKEPCRIGCNEA